MTAHRPAAHGQTDISGWIAHRAGWAPDDTAIRFEGSDISYAALEDRIGRLAGALADAFGIAGGDRVAHLGVNAPEMIELLFACARLGAIFVPLNGRLTVEEHLWQLRDCGAGAPVRRAGLFRPCRRNGGSVPRSATRELCRA